MRTAQKTIRDPDLRFADSETFGTFMEGLRALREYSKEAERDFPDRDTLNGLLDEAIEYLESCEAKHPENILPLYSLGLALTMRNQLHYAKMLCDRGRSARDSLEALRAELEALESSAALAERHTPWARDQGQANLAQARDRYDDAMRNERVLGPPPPQGWPLLNHAEELFRMVKQNSKGQLETAATFNLAHVYAKREEGDDLRKASHLLEGIPTTAEREGGKPNESDPYYPLLRLLRRLLLRRGQTAPRPKLKFDESMATWLQSQVLLESVSIRIELRSKPTNVSIEPQMNQKQQLINEAKIPAAVKIDLLADIQTKMGFLTYLWAFATTVTSEDTAAKDREAALSTAERHLRNALELKKNWDPAQIYLAQVLQAQSRFDEAERCLEAVLGTSRAEAQKASAEDGDSQTAQTQSDLRDATSES